MRDLYKEHEEKFGRITSHIYSGFVNLGVLKLHDFVYKDIKKRINRSTKSILDIGFGNGLVLEKLAKDKAAGKIELYGIDPSTEMLKIAKGKSAKTGHKINLRLGSSRLIPFKKKFDIVYTSLSYHHWKDRESAIPYILKRINKNGSFIIYEYDKDARIEFRLMHGHMISKGDFKDLSFKGFRVKIRKSQHIISIEFKNHGGR